MTMTEAELIHIQIESACKSRVFHLGEVERFRTILPALTPDTPAYDTCAGQIDYHTRQADKWRVYLKQLGWA
jgi:hypothetical protein